MSQFLNGFREYRSQSDLDAYEKKISNWIREVVDNGDEKVLAQELLAFAKKEEQRLENNKTLKVVENNSKYSDNSRVAELK